jgi:hypothetical protein
MPYLTVGASGAIYGLLLAFGMTFPDRYIYLWFMIPIKAKYLVLLLGGIEFITAFFAADTGVAHFAHLGGIVAGFLYIIIMGNLKKRKKQKDKIVELEDFLKRKETNKNVDEILDKIIKKGIDSLTKDERQKLIDAGHYFENFDKKV